MSNDDQSPFNVFYQKIKAAVIVKMKEQKTGTVTMPFSQIEGYLSGTWMNLIRSKLQEDLSEEFGITSVKIQSAYPQREQEAAFVIE